MDEAVRFFLDQHLPRAIAAGLRARGIDAVTAAECGRCGWEDARQLSRCLAEGRVLVTCDRDFLALDAAKVPHAGIIWCPASRCRVGPMITSLLLIHRVLTHADMRGHIEYI